MPNGLMDTPPRGILIWISGKFVTASSVEALPRQVPSGEKVFIHNSIIYGLWILAHAWTMLGPINPSGLPVTEMIPQVSCLSSSCSLCFFRDVLGMPNFCTLLSPLFLLPGKPSFLHFVQCSQGKWLRPIQEHKTVFPSKQFCRRLSGCF